MQSRLNFMQVELWTCWASRHLIRGSSKSRRNKRRMSLVLGLNMRQEAELRRLGDNYMQCSLSGSLCADDMPTYDACALRAQFTVRAQRWLGLHINLSFTPYTHNLLQLQHMLQVCKRPTTQACMDALKMVCQHTTCSRKHSQVFQLMFTCSCSDAS